MKSTLKHVVCRNNSKEKIKLSVDGLLLQSSTVVEIVAAAFAMGGEKIMRGSYIEFVHYKNGREVHADSYANEIFWNSVI